MSVTKTISISGEVNIVATITGNFTVVVKPSGPPPLSMNPQGGNLPDEMVGSASSDAVCIVSGGVAPYSFAVAGGSVPPGMQLAAVQNSDGNTEITLEGTPTQSGAFSFALAVTDAAGTTTTVKVGG